MKNFTTTNNPAATKNFKVLNLNDLTTIFGGGDDVVNPEDLLGNTNIIEDVYEL
jgi:hypothetical protein